MSLESWKERRKNMELKKCSDTMAETSKGHNLQIKEAELTTNRINPKKHKNVP